MKNSARVSKFSIKLESQERQASEIHHISPSTEIWNFTLNAALKNLGVSLFIVFDPSIWMPKHEQDKDIERPQAPENSKH